MKQAHNTSWQNVGKWDNTYFQDHVIGPGVVRLLAPRPGDSVLDLASGNNWLAKKLPKGISYTGLDLVRGQDVTMPLFVPHTFTHATIILALQNIEFPDRVIKNAAGHLTAGGKLVIVLNHPAFRIPRQSSWGIDQSNKLQYRRINRYMSSLKIPISMHPGVSQGPTTWSFHEPISFYAKLLHDNGFIIEQIEEWTSDRESVGRAAKMENRSRAEFPLFLAIGAKLEK